MNPTQGESGDVGGYGLRGGGFDCGHGAFPTSAFLVTQLRPNLVGIWWPLTPPFGG